MTFPAQTRASRPRRLPVLPQFYYHENFCDMLEFVAARYDHCLRDQDLDFIAAFRALPFEAQCLYVRLAGRKGRVFNTEKITYPEIQSLETAHSALTATAFTGIVDEDTFAAFLGVLTKPELTSLMQTRLDRGTFKPSWKKAVLVEAFMAHGDWRAVNTTGFIVQQRAQNLRYLQYLYFGKIAENLQPFTLRDLGLVKAPDHKPDYAARFDTLDEAQSAYFYADALALFKTGRDADVARLIDTVGAWPAPLCDVSAAGQDKLLQKLGGLSERLGDIDTALSLYERSDSPLCNERTIRLRWTRGETDWVKARLAALIESPGTDAEHVFASDFYARKFNKKRTSIVTDILREGTVMQIDEAYRNTPERAAVRAYEAKGYAAYFAENQLWRMLFGLLFWDVLYGEDAALHNSFERIPATLKSRTFYSTFKDTIETKLSALSEPSTAFVALLKTVSRHHGTANGIFRWNGRTLDKVKALLLAAPPGALAHMLRLMAQDYPQTKNGFPDLLLIKDGRAEFVEVKAQGDVIRRNQLTRIQQLRLAGFKTDITRIEWTIDPAQIYVVVDVETTGGRADTHRLTEIGAVKLQGGEVIDEWQTLLNPQRLIPPKITSLTGITNDMVAGAPLFHEIADEFRTFMGDAIFAAHNVNFDYKFISAEYRRMDQNFRFPKICTVASMRRLYPGYKSYGLKNICREFDIELTTHHRALCDAKAAAELLKLVNIKRLKS